MKKILASSKGTDFINDINDNFAECMTLGGSGTFLIKVPLQGGELKETTGYADGRWSEPETLTIGQTLPTFTYTDDNYNKYLHTPCYLSLRGNKVKSVTEPSGSTLSIFCYDDSFTLLSGGVVNDEDDIPAGTAYIKMQIYNSSGFSQVVPLDMTLAAHPQWVKNSFTPLLPQYHNYECHPPKLWNSIPVNDSASIDYSSDLHSMPTDDTLDADNTRYHDNCFVMLPPNYSPNGKPVKFVIFFAGDGCMWFTGHTPFLGFEAVNGIYKVTTSVYEKNLKYLNNCGFAVVSCGGYTSMWSGERGATGNTSAWIPRGSQAYLASARGFYDFLMANYNFDPRPFVAGKSAGGYMTLHTAATLPFPVRAAAGFSIICSMADRLVENSISNQKTQQKMMGCANWNKYVLNQTPYNYSGDGTRASYKSGATQQQQDDADRLMANTNIYRSLDPFTAMSDIDYDAYMNQVLRYDPFEDVTPPQDLLNLLNNSHKNMRVPVKLWCATKDPSTPFAWHKLYADWVKRCNGICELRSYTENDGTHHTFCGGTSGGGKVINNLSTPYGVTMNGVNIGFVEAVEWFKRW